MLILFCHLATLSVKVTDWSDFVIDIDFDTEAGLAFYGEISLSFSFYKSSPVPVECCVVVTRRSLSKLLLVIYHTAVCLLYL